LQKIYEEETAMVKLKAIRHTGVKITDVTKAKEFYGQILGMTELPRPELPIPGAWYECNGVQVHLIGDNAKMRDIPGVGAHIAVQVEDLEQAKAELTARGIAFQELTPPPSMRANPVLFVRDPDGNVVELRTDE
jgi:catechol 2,3-dioxygenase-like lactoylglutathione lyase family enzyme